MPILLQTLQIMKDFIWNKLAISSKNLFVLRVNLYDEPLCIQSHVRIMKLASVGNLIRL